MKMCQVSIIMRGGQRYTKPMAVPEIVSSYEIRKVA
jgi:hypothetical protein